MRYRCGSVSPGLNDVRGAQDNEKQSTTRRASREGACRNVRPDAPNKNYTIKHNTLIVNKTNNKICIIANNAMHCMQHIP